MSYTQLTQEQRYLIRSLLKMGYHHTEIAECLEVHKSTISRELRRNKGLHGYRPSLLKQIELGESAGPDSDEYSSTAWWSTLIGIAIGIIASLIVLLMSFQPSLWSLPS